MEPSREKLQVPESESKMKRFQEGKPLAGGVCMAWISHSGISAPGQNRSWENESHQTQSKQASERLPHVRETNPGRNTMYSLLRSRPTELFQGPLPGRAGLVPRHTEAFSTGETAAKVRKWAGRGLEGEVARTNR